MKNIKLIISVLRASFISLVPYYILHSFLLLFIEICKYFYLFDNIFILQSSYNIVHLLSVLLPVLLNISISYHLSSIIYITLNRFLTMILSLSIFFSVDVVISQSNSISTVIPQSFILALLIPLFSTYMLNYFVQCLTKYQNKLQKSLSSSITTMIVYMMPFFIVFLLVTFLFSYLSLSFYNGDSIILFNDLEGDLLLFARSIIPNILWFFGIHGFSFFDSIVNVSILHTEIYSNLRYGNFFNLFILLGGVGSGLSLLLAIFISSKDKHTSFIAKIATPFVIFNINEILIFGIPIVMNFSLLIPFLLVPIINLVLSYLLLSYTDFIVFNDIVISWVTPVLVNMYLLTDGNLLAVLFQLFLIALGTLIYIPFIKKYTCAQSSTISMENMASKFDITTSIESQKDIKFQEAQSSLIKSHYKINDIIEKINHNNLVIYYQPKVNIQTNSCNSFEALLRIKNSDGTVRGPDFIVDIENSGLASILDIWVCKEVKKDLDKWSQQNFYPQVSINLFPHTLEDKTYVSQIIEILEEYNVDFEIIERRSSLNKKLYENVHLLKKNNFEISLDDLGIGYTNFSMLYEIPFNTVKIDKKIIGFTNTEKGLLLYQNICELCVNQNLKIVLEGIETKDEYELLINTNISFVQGWYFSKALPFEEIENYSKNFSK